jgi:inner membrane protein
MLLYYLRPALLRRFATLDNITHTLVALTLARSGLRRAGRGTTAALVLSSNAPDADIVATARGAVAYLRWHRGPTHGPLGVIGLGILSAGLVWTWLRVADRRRAADPSPAALFGMLCAVGIIGALVHVLMDVPTSYGVRLFSPFDWHWLAADWMPIIDVYLLMALAIGLVFGRASAAAARRNAAIVLALMAANYGLRAVAHARALGAAPRVFGARLPPPCDGGAATAPAIDRWPREGVKTTSDLPNRRCLVELAALPSFLSPFDWRLVARLSNAYEMQDVSLLDARLSGDGTANWRVTLRPNVWTPAALAAAATPDGQVYLGFSRFPEARTFVDRAGGATVRFNDMRFAGPLFAAGRQGRRAEPFTLTTELRPDGGVVRQTLGW